MRKLLALVLLALFAACTDQAGTDTDIDEADTGTDFTLTGTVAEVRPGEEAEGVPDPDGDTDVGARTGGQADEESIEPGVIVVETDEEVADCPAEDEGYAVYFRGDTAFDPIDTPHEDDFPRSLEGAEVEVDGTYYTSDDDSCVFVAQSIMLPQAGIDSDERPSGQTATFSPGPRPTEAGVNAPATPAGDSPDEGTAPPDSR